jgi:hypothetical protein
MTPISRKVERRRYNGVVQTSGRWLFINCGSLRVPAHLRGVGATRTSPRSYLSLGTLGEVVEYSIASHNCHIVS